MRNIQFISRKIIGSIDAETNPCLVIGPWHSRHKAGGPTQFVRWYVVKLKPRFPEYPDWQPAGGNKAFRLYLTSVEWLLKPTQFILWNRTTYFFFLLLLLSLHTIFTTRLKWAKITVHQTTRPSQLIQTSACDEQIQLHDHASNIYGSSSEKSRIKLLTKDTAQSDLPQFTMAIPPKLSYFWRP